MQQTIAINIIDPASLPQTGTTITNLLTEHPLLFGLGGIVLIAIAIAFMSFRAKRSHVAKPISMLLAVAFLAPTLTSIDAFATTTNAAPNETIDIRQGETAVTFNTKVNVISTDGYDLGAQIDLSASIVPPGFELSAGANTLNSTTDTAVRNYRQAPDATDNGEIHYTITLPADAPLGNYASITINYTVDDYIAPAYLADLQTKMNAVAPNRLVSMQQLNSSICAASIYDATNYGNNSHNTITLSDTRNGQDYRVRKLPDLKCWMIDNLKLGDPVNPTNLTAADSNVPAAGYTLPPLMTFGLSVDTVPQVIDPSSEPFCATSPDLLISGSTSGCGYFYNFLAATGGWGTGWGSAVPVVDSNSPYSICPAGWHLPTGGLTVANVSSTDLNTLDIAFGFDGAIGSPRNPVLLADTWIETGAFAGLRAGYYHDAFLNPVNSGVWWSAAVYNIPLAYWLSVLTGSVNPATTTVLKSHAFAVRCVV